MWRWRHTRPYYDGLEPISEDETQPHWDAIHRSCNQKIRPRKQLELASMETVPWDIDRLYTLAKEHLPPASKKASSIWVAIICHTINKTSEIRPNSGFLFIKAHVTITVKTLHHHYFIRHPLNCRLFHNGELLLDDTKVGSLPQEDGFVILRAHEADLNGKCAAHPIEIDSDAEDHEEAYDEHSRTSACTNCDTYNIPNLENRQYGRALCVRESMDVDTQAEVLQPPSTSSSISGSAANESNQLMVKNSSLSKPLKTKQTNLNSWLRGKTSEPQDMAERWLRSKTPEPQDMIGHELTVPKNKKRLLVEVNVQGDEPSASRPAKRIKTYEAVDLDDDFARLIFPQQTDHNTGDNAILDVQDQDLDEESRFVNQKLAEGYEVEEIPGLFLTEVPEVAYRACINFSMPLDTTYYGPLDYKDLERRIALLDISEENKIPYRQHGTHSCGKCGKEIWLQPWTRFDCWWNPLCTTHSKALVRQRAGLSKDDLSLRDPRVSKITTEVEHLWIVKHLYQDQLDQRINMDYDTPLQLDNLPFRVLDIPLDCNGVPTCNLNDRPLLKEYGGVVLQARPLPEAWPRRRVPNDTSTVKGEAHSWSSIADDLVINDVAGNMDSEGLRHGEEDLSEEEEGDEDEEQEQEYADEDAEQEMEREDNSDEEEDADDDSKDGEDDEGGAEDYASDDEELFHDAPEQPIVQTLHNWNSTQAGVDGESPSPVIHQSHAYSESSDNEEDAEDAMIEGVDNAADEMAEDLQDENWIWSSDGGD